MAILTAFHDFAEEMGPWMWGWGFHVGLLWFIMMGLFWIALIVAVILFIRWLVLAASRKKHELRSEDSALEILRTRYAKGEINKEEFEQKKKDLGYR